MHGGHISGPPGKEADYTGSVSFHAILLWPMGLFTYSCFCLKVKSMKDLAAAGKKIIPISFSYIFVGLAFGMLLIQAGYSPWWAVGSALFIYAGSMQLVLVPLLVSSVPLHTIALMTFFINARHIFYGLGLVARFKAMGKVCPYMVLTLTDEVYSILCTDEYEPGTNPARVDFYVSLCAHLLWILSCAAGAWLGGSLSFALAGIEFSATAFFITVCVNQWHGLASKIPALTGLVSALLFWCWLGSEHFLLPALSLSVLALVILRDRVRSAGANRAE